MWIWLVPPQVLKRVGSLTIGVPTDRAVGPAIARGIVEIERQPRLPVPLALRVADPGSGRPRIDVEVFLISIARSVQPADVTHLADLVDRLVGGVKVVFP
jgi:hypothetical protein